MSSVSSVLLTSANRLTRISTDGWSSNRSVVKNGEFGSCTRANFSLSDSTQIMITSVKRSPVSGSTASGCGVRKKTNDLPPTW
jgi:hypothetical protein